MENSWHPDRATLVWLMGTADTSSLGKTVANDVKLRQRSSNDYSDESMWVWAVEATLEDLIIPLIRGGNPESDA